VLLVILLAANITRGPGVVMDTHGTGAGHSSGYLGAFLVASLASTYVMYGFDTASSLGEESRDPRRNAPKAILRALIASFVIGGLILLFALMAVGDINNPEISTGGLQFIVLDVLGGTVGKIFLWAVVIAITVCTLAVQSAAIRMMFAMARDNLLPAGEKLARISPKTKTPVIPAVITGVLAIAILVVNINQPQIFTVITSIGIIMIYLAYLLVTVPMLIKRLRGEWPPKDGGEGYLSLGRLGLPINILGVLWGAASWSISRGRAATSTTRHRRFTGTCSGVPCSSLASSRASASPTTGSCSDTTAGCWPTTPPKARRSRTRRQRSDGRVRRRRRRRRHGGVRGGREAVRKPGPVGVPPRSRSLRCGRSGRAGAGQMDGAARIRLRLGLPRRPQASGNSFLRHARARVLGGCSSHNSCIAFWAPAEDLDDWAALGLPGWSAADIYPLYQRLETNDGPGDHHGRSGRVTIRSIPPHDPTGVALLRACEQTGIPRTEFNSGKTVTHGANWFQINAREDGTRRPRETAQSGHPDGTCGRRS
jgi:hypothetical protein